LINYTLFAYSVYLRRIPIVADIRIYAQLYKVSLQRVIMVYKVLSVSEKERAIIMNNASVSSTTNQHVDYRNCVCIKPWGHEFLVYESDTLGIWCLTIRKGHGTSLHTHFHKDTFVIVLSGTAKLTLIDNEVIVLGPLSSVHVPKNKFHAFSSFSDEVVLLEIEIFDSTAKFSDKNDLLRIDDQYNRKKTGYEGSVQKVYDNLDTYDYFNIHNGFTRTLNGTTISVSNTYTQVDDITTGYTILLRGTVYADGQYLKEGSIMNRTTPPTSDPSNLFMTVRNLYSMEDSKIIHSFEQLQAVVAETKKMNKKIVLTSGCYDILHVGHLYNLKTAKSLCDTFFVALSSDAQIQKLKGASRPVNTYNDRINVFKTLPYIDYIILYDEENIEKEETLGQIMKIVGPNIWTKGSDYTVEKIVDKHPYLNKVVIIDNVKDKSTTNIIKKIEGSSR
jgi:rfaE bifunctional protein nucleotidyltransferase chain/domain